MAGPGNILIKVGVEAGQAIRELSSVDKSLDSTASTSDKMGATLKKAALPAAAALTAIGVAAFDATKAAAEDASAQEHLAGVLERVAGASKAQVAATEDWIAGISRATGVADDELRPALEKIVTSTHDVGKAQGFLKQALDISAASGKDVESVATAIALAYQGQTAKLEKLVPGLSEAAKKSDDFNVIMGELAKTTGGAMADSAETATGQYKIFSNQMNELQETLGAALLPVIQALLPIMNSLAQFASQNTTAIKILVAAVAALSAGILVANAAMKAYEAIMVVTKVATAAWTAAQWLLNAALTANPIGLVIVAIAALAAGLVVAYTRSETFRSIVAGAMNAVLSAVRALDSAFDFLLSAAKSAFNWITDHWKLGLFAFGPIGAAAYLIATNFDKVRSAAVAAFDAISGAVSGIASAIESVISAVERLISAIGRIHVPHIDLPGPFSAPAPDVMPSRSRGRAAGTLAPFAAAGGTTINVFGAVDPEGTARTILRILEQHQRRQGR